MALETTAAADPPAAAAAVEASEKEAVSGSSSSQHSRTAELPAGAKDGDVEKLGEQPEPSPPSADGQQMGGVRWLLVCVAIFSANLLYGLDVTIAADIQASVAETFDEIPQLGWLGIGFTLGSVASILPLGKAYAVFDTKWLFIACLVMFEAGSALCGGAPNMNAIIVGRVWAGAGGAGMYLGNINLITIHTTPAQQPKYIGLIGLVWGIGLILGPIIGGLFSDSAATWRWAFYINILIFALMAPIYFFVLPSTPRRPGTTFLERIRTMDALGILLNAGIYVALVLFCTFGSNGVWGWRDGRTIACIVVFAVLVVAFAVTQAFAVGTTPANRLFPCEMIRNRTLVLLYILIACGSASVFVAVYYVPLYFQFVSGDTGTQSAIRLLPFVCFYVSTVTACGLFMAKTGYYIVWYLFSGIFLVAGAACMYTVAADTPVAHIYGFTILIAVGTTTSQAAYAIGPTVVTPDRIPEVLQFMNISQGQSLLLGLTIASAIFQSTTVTGLRGVLEPLGYSEFDIESVVAGARSTILTHLPADVRARALAVIVKAIDDVYVMVIAAGCLYVLCSAFLPRKRFS